MAMAFGEFVIGCFHMSGLLVRQVPGRLPSWKSANETPDQAGAFETH